MAYWVYVNDKYLVAETAERDLLDVLKLHPILHGHVLGVQEHERVTSYHQHHSYALGAEGEGGRKGR